MATTCPLSPLAYFVRSPHATTLHLAERQQVYSSLNFSCELRVSVVYSPVRDAAKISVIGVRIEMAVVTIWCDASVTK